MYKKVNFLSHGGSRILTDFSDVLSEYFIQVRDTTNHLNRDVSQRGGSYSAKALVLMVTRGETFSRRGMLSVSISSSLACSSGQNVSRLSKRRGYVYRLHVHVI